jgi:hypothetical protein
MGEKQGRRQEAEVRRTEYGVRKEERRQET